MSYPPPYQPGPPPPLPLPRPVYLPVVAEPYARTWRAPAIRWWRPVVAIVAGAAAFLVVSIVFGLAGAVAGMAFDPVRTQTVFDAAQRGEIVMTPILFLANNVSLALLIPLSMLLAWAFSQQRPGWLSSVTGRFRWGWFATCLMVVVPIWLVLTLAESWMAPEGEPMRVNPDTWFMIATILLTTPLQAAGEEYAMRGYLNKALGWFTSNRVVGLVLGAVGSSVVFMLIHGAGDGWLNLFYFTFGLAACYLTWRTGGLEAAVAVHVVNNVVAMASLPFVDISSVFNREQGTGDPSVLIHIAVMVVAVAIIDRLAARRGIAAEFTPRPLPTPQPMW